MKKKERVRERRSRIKIEVRQKLGNEKSVCCIVLSAGQRTTSRGSQTDRPAVGTINRTTGVTGGHSQRSTDSRPSS